MPAITIGSERGGNLVSASDSTGWPALEAGALLRRRQGGTRGWAGGYTLRPAEGRPGTAVPV